jgi:hypothetical protein
MKNILATALILQASCASITASRTDRLKVSATPPGAIVTMDGDNRGAAPVTVDVPRGRQSTVEITAPGFRAATCDTSMSPGGGYIAADVVLCVLLFPVGCISFIDAGGAWNELRSPVCSVSLLSSDSH